MCTVSSSSPGLMAGRCTCRSWSRSGSASLSAIGRAGPRSLRSASSPSISASVSSRSSVRISSSSAKGSSSPSKGKGLAWLTILTSAPGSTIRSSSTIWSKSPGSASCSVSNRRSWPRASAKRRTVWRGVLSMSMSELAVHFEGVGKEYPHFILDDINLQLPAGGIMGFIGANGAGKSTTIRILMGLVQPDRGRVEVLGLPMPEQQAQAKSDIGFASEDLRLYKAATLAWHMTFIRSIYPGWDDRYAELLLKRFDLKPQQKIKGLSHGQRVKAALLLILARHPRVLVLDEPTTGLDPVARQEVLSELMEVVADEQRTIFFSSQNTLDVEQISDQITFIDRGRIIDSGDKEMFLDRWRRMRLDIPPGVHIPVLPGIVDSRSSGRLSVLTTSDYDPAMAAACQDAGATVCAIDTMTLEEIFVANVLSRRAGRA